jgi:phosphoribosylformylglycinamidine (FGAM) synthase-like enzyme
MCLGGDLGARLITGAMNPARWDVQLFSESNGRWLVEVAEGREDEFQHLMEGVPLTYVGRVGGTSLRLSNGKKSVSLLVTAMRKAWSEAIPRQVVVS